MGEKTKKLREAANNPQLLRKATSYLAVLAAANAVDGAKHLSSALEAEAAMHAAAKSSGQAAKAEARFDYNVGASQKNGLALIALASGALLASSKRAEVLDAQGGEQPDQSTGSGSAAIDRRGRPHTRIQSMHESSTPVDRDVTSISYEHASFDTTTVEPIRTVKPNTFADVSTQPSARVQLFPGQRPGPEQKS